VRRREEDPARVGEDQLLDVDVGNAEHEHVVEPLAAVGVDRVGPAAAVEAEHLRVDEVRRPAVAGDLLRRLREGERERVDVGHRRHRSEVNSIALASSASTLTLNKLGACRTTSGCSCSAPS
jgi:hypothetical protein